MTKVGLQLDIPEMQEGEEDATERQIQFIRALMSQVGASGFPDELFNDLGKWQASALIGQLKSFQSELEGNKPLDTDRLTGLEKQSSWPRETGMAVLLSVVFIVVVLWLSS